jgi:hypothetical protein
VGEAHLLEPIEERILVDPMDANRAAKTAQEPFERAHETASQEKRRRASSARRL